MKNDSENEFEDAVDTFFELSTSKFSLANTRQGRLEMLRNRMRKEFGPVSAPNETLISPENDTESNSLSECTSLASWGKNLLMEQHRNGLSSQLIAVYPADSLSTKAAPALAQSANYSNSTFLNGNSRLSSFAEATDNNVSDINVNNIIEKNLNEAADINLQVTSNDFVSIII